MKDSYRQQTKADLRDRNEAIIEKFKQAVQEGGECYAALIDSEVETCWSSIHTHSVNFLKLSCHCVKIYEASLMLHYQRQFFWNQR